MGAARRVLKGGGSPFRSVANQFSRHPVPPVRDCTLLSGRLGCLLMTEKVLIFEDEKNERSGLADLISAWGYRTETAQDGVEALEKVAAWGPGIVVTDHAMPRLTGFE